ncbi:MAG: hypothetical protein JFAIHJKO_02924 [Pyrinomonadaceae bacterium]|nr:hypothetical protein [Pyrinomonadaceae bacterium]
MYAKASVFSPFTNDAQCLVQFRGQDRTVFDIDHIMAFASKIADEAAANLPPCPSAIPKRVRARNDLDRAQIDLS